MSVQEAEIEEVIDDDAVADGDEGAFEEASTLSGVEQLAAELGWKPESEWKGDKTNWTDAATFLKATAAKAESTRKELREAQKSVDAQVQRRVDALEKTLRRSQERELASIRSKYNAAIRNAVKEGDEDLENELRKELEDVEGEYEDLNEVPLTPEQVEKAENEFVESFPVLHPKLQKPFWQEHAWILDDDADIEDFAMIEAEITRLVVDGGKPLHEALDSAGEILMRAFPDRYEVDEEEAEPTPKRRAAPRTPVIASAGRKAGRSMASRLPPEARKIAKKEIEAGNFGSYEEWTEVYVESGGELL